MKILFYSEDDGRKALKLAKQQCVEPAEGLSLTDYQTGQIVYIGRNLEGHALYICGVSQSKPVCQQAWIHALSEIGCTISSWIFYEVT
ncbi:MAG: hypothetical protein H0Z33_02195 [Bacillaceae bacterium]|nr:hypothetical protein [Bacillaceae bacterium]